jgi:hypothetical protein
VPSLTSASHRSPRGPASGADCGRRVARQPRVPSCPTSSRATSKQLGRPGPRAGALRPGTFRRGRGRSWT